VADSPLFNGESISPVINSTSIPNYYKMIISLDIVQLCFNFCQVVSDGKSGVFRNNNKQFATKT
jgi:hypothetical protein